MCAVLLPLGFNPTTVKKCINTLTYSLCVNVYCVIAAGCLATAVNKCINTST